MPEKRYKNVLKKISNYQKIRYVVTKYQTDFKSNNDGLYSMKGYTLCCCFCGGRGVHHFDI